MHERHSTLSVLDVSVARARNRLCTPWTVADDRDDDGENQFQRLRVPEVPNFDLSYYDVWLSGTLTSVEEDDARE